jgi:membrane-bound lytic murein transglycosylase A
MIGMKRFRHSRDALAVVLTALLAAGCAIRPVPPPPPPVPPKIESAARYDPVNFESLPATTDQDWVATWPALLQSCRALERRDAWREVCVQTLAIDAQSAAAIRQFFATYFDAYRIVERRLQDGKETEARTAGLVTGYYEPMLRGSRARSDKYSVPLYRVPDDLLIVDLASVYPELANLRLRGKLQGRRVVPYPARSEITDANPLAGSELLWVDDPIEAFFLQIQGSGRVQFESGDMVRVGYGDQNGHPYRSIGRWLVEQGELTLDQASMQGIKAWTERNPARLKELLDRNPSYVFFRELPLGDPKLGPVGALGVALTPGYSLAADRRFVPLGALVVLATTDPTSGAALTRPMLVQDTGGAITGPLRFDFFWGYGAQAGERAGRQRTEGRAWVLVPKGTLPEALLKR